MNALLKPVRRNGSSITVPLWFLEECRAAWAAYTATGKRMSDLGRELAAAINRPGAWGHSPISKFLDGSQVTSHLAEAFCARFKIPQFVYYPRDLPEAKLIQRTIDESPQTGERSTPDAVANANDAPAPTPLTGEKTVGKKMDRLRQYDAHQVRIDRQRRGVLQNSDAASVRDRRVGSGRKKPR